MNNSYEIASNMELKKLIKGVFIFVVILNFNDKIDKMVIKFEYV